MASLSLIKNENLFQIEKYQDKIEYTQRYMTLLEENIAKLAYKTSKVRDTGDEMAQDLQDFAQKDNYDSLLTNNIKNVAYCLSAIEDHRDLNIEYLNSEMLHELRLFNETIKYSKTELKSLLDTFNRDQCKKKSIFNMLIKTNEIHDQYESLSIENEMALIKAKDLNEKLTKTINKFENIKLNNIQNILKNYISSEIAFHEKAIRLYSNALKSLNSKDKHFDIKQDINSIVQKRNCLENNFIEYKKKYTLKRRSLSESSISNASGSDFQPAIKFIQISNSNSSIQLKLQNKIQSIEQYFSSSEDEKFIKSRTSVIPASSKSNCSKETKL